MLKRYFPIILISTIVIAIYFQVIIEMVAQWWDDSNYSHGLLIPFVSGYLIWQKKESLQNIILKKSNLSRGQIISDSASKPINHSHPLSGLTFPSQSL